ncbi:hypothetical protein QF000_006872 [Paraburkholderia atlantica]|uniref:DUF6566 family protein n=1 Tax=Paraburkholderia atlantica TaxID=2654982 RepID=UPI001590829A|nr:DUF6566 family protein [Paraburkholderia atlantica]MBB5415913.1 hypothetical protein [Paraburkholderia atlantica]NUY31151.1 hypothetical protein [Paraburkholderia atlantica]
MTPLPPTDHTDHSAGASIGETGSDMTTADGRAMPAGRDERAPLHAMHGAHRGALITVTAHRNSRGAWIADVSISRDGRPMEIPANLANVEPVTPEWLTEAEALRAGIEQGRYLIDRTLGEHAAPLSASQRRLDEDR